MSVQSELLFTARAIRAHQPPEATLLHAVAALLDQVALTTPESVIETQASPIVRKSLAVARAYRAPGASLTSGDSWRGKRVSEMTPAEIASMAGAR